MRWWLLTICVSAPASAAPLEMRYLKSENLHIANQGGAISWHDEVTLTLDLAPSGKLAGSERGTARQHDLYDTYTTDDEQTWTHRWSGTWKRAGDTLALDVVLDARTCTRTKQTTGASPQPLPCGKVSGKLHLDCTTRSVTLRAPGARDDKRLVWECTPAGAVELDRTPRPWVFGKSRCVKMLGGRGGVAYEPC